MLVKKNWPIMWFVDELGKNPTKNSVVSDMAQLNLYTLNKIAKLVSKAH